MLVEFGSPRGHVAASRLCARHRSKDGSRLLSARGGAVPSLALPWLSLRPCHGCGRSRRRADGVPGALSSPCPTRSPQASRASAAFKAAVVASDEQITALPTSMVTGTALRQRLMPMFFVFMAPRLLCIAGLCVFDVEGGRMLVSDCCEMISETRDSVTDETVALYRLGGTADTLCPSAFSRFGPIAAFAIT
jgi:hypothetical protein